MPPDFWPQLFPIFLVATVAGFGLGLGINTAAWVTRQRKGRNHT